jgi:anaphase-promoting complex subunit 1
MRASKATLTHACALPQTHSAILEESGQSSACTITSLRATRKNVWDLLVVKPLGELSILTHSLCELPMTVRHASELDNRVSPSLKTMGSLFQSRKCSGGTTIVTYKDG